MIAVDKREKERERKRENLNAVDNTERKREYKCS